MNRTIRFLLLFFVAATSGCGGASEAGPRWKPTPTNGEFRYSPESASNVTVTGRKKLPDWP